jgi:arabinose-5-phosphate isomerase
MIGDITITLREIVIAMTEKPLGGALIVGENNHLDGIRIDGDLRRALKINKSMDVIFANDIKTTTPRTVTASVYLSEALNIMESGPSSVCVFPVVGEHHCAVCLLLLHDVYQK